MLRKGIKGGRDMNKSSRAKKNSPSMKEEESPQVVGIKIPSTWAVKESENAKIDSIENLTTKWDA